MMNRLKTAILVFILFAVSSFFLSSCTSMVCLSGLCPTPKEVAARIPWNPPSLSHQNCQNISGKYRTGTFRTARYNDMLMREFPQSNDKFGFIRVVLETPEKEPKAEFYSSAHVLIQQSEHNLVVSLIGQDGKLYRRQTIDLNSPMIGCAGGDFIIRTISSFGGGPEGGGYYWARATENRFRKLADGGLQVMEYRRRWNYDPAFGLSGQNPDGSPKEERGAAVIYQSVP